MNPECSFSGQSVYGMEAEAKEMCTVWWDTVQPTTNILGGSSMCKDLWLMLKVQKKAR